MLGFSRILRVSSKRLSFTAGVTLAVVGLLSISALGTGRASAATCTDNDIIKCGFSTAANFISKVRTNANGVNSKQDLQAIYAKYGLSPADYDNFAAHAVSGEAMSNGDVKLDTGQVVATGGMSLGRQHFDSSDKAVPIAGTTYYSGTNANRFAAGVTQIPVYVLLNAQGQYVFSVMKVCGNPEIATPRLTSAACSVLNESPVAGKPGTYTFSAAATAKGNATITKFVYNFGDGTSKTMTTGASFTHTYSKEGVYNASVTVFASVPGNSNLQLSSVSLCAKQITVVAVECVVNGAILDRDKFKYSFTATGRVTVGSAKLVSADFSFGDGHTQTGVKPNSDGTTVTTTYAYAAAGTYNANAVLHFTDSNGQVVTTTACPAVVTPTTPPTPECKPGVPVGSAECTPCQFDSNLPSNSPQCIPPPLPNTGAGNTVAIFAGVVIVGFMIYRQLVFRKHRAAFAAAEQGTSPLPLADPLNQDEPLAGTPYATHAKKRASFRRKRPF